MQAVVQTRKDTRVLLLYRSFDPSVKLCAYLQLRWLEEKGYLRFRHSSILAVTRQDLDWAQMVFFVRGDGLLDELVAKMCLGAGKRVVYVLDDDLLHVPLELGSGTFYAQRSVKAHIENLMEWASCFASPSSVLLEKYGGRSRSSFRIMEPAAYSLEGEKPDNGGTVRIGFAGSTDRGRDIDRIIGEALTEIVRRYGEKVSVEFFGVSTDIARTLRCKTYPFSPSYEQYQAEMARLNWDVGLAPMPETPFHACKYYNKLVEYCGFGIVGVYSDVTPYREAVEHEVTGMLCKNDTDSWVEALSRLIEDSELRRTMAENCLARARGAFSVESSALDMMGHLAALETPDSMAPVKGNLRWIKLRGLVSWNFEKFTKYGWKTPVFAVKKIVQLIRKED